MPETETGRDPARDWRRWAVPGAALVLPIHGMTDNWALAIGIAFGSVATLAGGYVVVQAKLHSSAPTNKPKTSRRIGWASRSGVLLAALLLISATATAFDSHKSHSDKLSAGIAIPILVAYIALALTGLITRGSRAAWRSLPSGRNARNSVIGLAVTAIVMTFMALAGYISVSGMRAHGVVAQASIVDVTSSRNTDTYFLQYTLPSGRVIRCSTENVVGRHDPGAQIQVRYDSSSPSASCQSADYTLGYGMPSFFLDGGAVLLSSRSWCGQSRLDGNREGRAQGGADRLPGN